MVLTTLNAPWYAVLLMAGAASTLPLLFVLRKRAGGSRRMEAQLPEAADLISRALRAGHSLPSALDMAGNELAGAHRHGTGPGVRRDQLRHYHCTTRWPT